MVASETRLSCIGHVIVLCVTLTLLSGCGGGGGGGGTTIPPPAQPPQPPWRLSIYESDSASPVAEGVLTVERDGYVLAVTGGATQTIKAGRGDIRRIGDVISLPIGQSRRENFRQVDLDSALRDISQGRPTELRSADQKRIYTVRREGSPQVVKPAPAVTEQQNH